MDDSKTFREELAIQHPTLGRALWEPDPGGYIMPYKWATLASFAMAISIASSMLYSPEMLRQITHPNRTLIQVIRPLFSDYNPGHRIISARV